MKTTFPVIACLLAAVTCFGQWQLIDNFNQWQDLDMFTDAEEIGWNAYSLTETSKFFIWEAFGDLALDVLPVCNYDNHEDHGRTFIMKEIPGGGIAPGESAVLYFRSLWTDEQHSGWTMGTTDKSLEYDDVTGRLVSPGEYGDFNAEIRLSTGEYSSQRIFTHRDGGQYVDTNPPVIIQFYQWYHFWIYIKNYWDSSVTPPICMGAYKLYVQGPDDSEPQLVPLGTDPPKEWASFRRLPASEDGRPQNIQYFMFGTEAVAAFSNYFDSALDDIYFIKITGWDTYRWLNYPTKPASDTDTGTFLGWLNVTQAPYIWSYALNGWLYMKEPAGDAPGAWGYFFK